MSNQIDPLSCAIGRLEAIAERVEGALGRLETRVSSLEHSRRWVLGAIAAASAILGALGSALTHVFPADTRPTITMKMEKPRGDT